MNQPNPIKNVDDLLAEYIDTYKKAKSYSEIKQALLADVLEIVGSDILIETEGKHLGRKMKPTRGKLHAINRERAEIRTKLTKYFGGSDE